MIQQRFGIYTGTRFGIESMRGKRDAENNQRDYGIEQKFESGLRD